MGYSKQRQQILMALGDSNSHPSAEEVFATLRSSGPQISLATIYRNLNALTERGQVRRIPVSNGADRYELERGDHDHMICDRCGQVLDVPLQDLHRAVDELEDKGAVVTGHTLIYHGLCAKCAKELAQEDPSAETPSSDSPN